MHLTASYGFPFFLTVRMAPDPRSSHDNMVHVDLPQTALHPNFVHFRSKAEYRSLIDGAYRAFVSRALSALGVEGHGDDVFDDVMRYETAMAKVRKPLWVRPLLLSRGHKSIVEMYLLSCNSIHKRNFSKTAMWTSGQTISSSVNFVDSTVPQSMTAQFLKLWNKYKCNGIPSTCWARPQEVIACSGLRHCRALFFFSFVRTNVLKKYGLLYQCGYTSS